MAGRREEYKEEETGTHWSVGWGVVCVEFSGFVETGSCPFSV